MVDKLRLLSSSHSTYLCCLNRKTVYALTMTSHSGIAIFFLRFWVHFRISFISLSYCFIWGEKIRTSTYLYTTNVDHLQFRRQLTRNIPKINDHRFSFYFIIARQIFEFLSVECLYHFGSRMCDDRIFCLCERIFLSVWTFFVCVLNSFSQNIPFMWNVCSLATRFSYDMKERQKIVSDHKCVCVIVCELNF